MACENNEEFDNIFLRNTDIVIPCRRAPKNQNKLPTDRQRRKSCHCRKCGDQTNLEKKISEALPQFPIKHHLKNPLTRRQNQFARAVLSIQGSLNLILQFKSN